MTLSCKVGSMKLRPEWPWRTRRYKIVPDESVQYWNLFLFPPPPAIHFFHLSSDQWGQYRKCFWRLSVILQNSIAPSSSRCINFFDATSKSESEYFSWFNIGPSFFPMGTVLGEEPAGSLLCGFALAFDRHAKSFASNFNAYSSSWTSGISCSLLFKFITNLFDPWENLTHEWELSVFVDIILISTPYLPCKQQVATFQHGPNFGVPSDPTFRFRSTFVSWQSVFTTGRCTELWEFCSVFPHEILSNFNNIQKSCIHTKFCSICLVVIAFQFVLHTIAIEDLCEPGHHNPKALLSWSHFARVRNLIAPRQRVAPISREGFRTLHTPLQLLRRDWADLQKQLCENSLNRFQIGWIVYRQFSMTFGQ